MGRAQDHRESSEVRAPTAGRVVSGLPCSSHLAVHWGSHLGFSSTVDLGGNVVHILSFPNQGWPGGPQGQRLAHSGTAPCCPQAEGPRCRQLVLRSIWEEQQLSPCLFLLLVHITCDCLCEGHDNLWREKTAFCLAVLLGPPSSTTRQTARPPSRAPGG